LHIPVANLDDLRLTRISQIGFAREYNPEEPRVPKGDPHGGEWTASGEATSASPDASNSNSSSATPTDVPSTPGIYAVTTDNGSSPTPFDNGDGSSPSSSEPPMKFEWGPPVAAPPTPPPADGDNHDAEPATAGSDDVDGPSAVGSGTTEQPDQLNNTASGDTQSGPSPVAPPEIPGDPPGTKQQINAVLRSLATWFGRALALLGAAYELDPRVAMVLSAIEATIWLADYLPKVWSYLDEPRTLQELQDAVRTGLGYETHHIVEAQYKNRDPNSNSQRFGVRLESRENLVRVPYWKHVEISSWYSKPNKKYGGLFTTRFSSEKELG
jgi:hypothetical protein